MSILKTIYLQHINGAAPNATLDANGNMTITGTIVSSSPTGGMRNRIINGDMRIDQRNAGASVSISTNDSSIFVTDRWQIIKNSSATISAQQSSTAPTGFNNSLLVNVSSGSAVGSGNYLVAGQRIEGFNFADFLYGTSAAKTLTLSFWVRSSLPGTYTVALVNSANNREYIATYTILSANTWEYETITIPGDTTGTWIGSTNGAGLNVYFALGYGTSFQGTTGSWTAQTSIFGSSSTQNTFLTATNTFYITGVQIEEGTIATPFERRLYSTELSLCQRYCQTLKQGVGVWISSTACQLNIPYFQQMRAAPTVSQTATITVTDYIAVDLTQSSTSISITNGNDQYGTTVTLGNFSGATGGRTAGIRNYSGTGVIILSAEL